MSEREWRFYLDDMMGCVEKAMAYSHGFEQAEFEASGVNYDATLRNLELIGEAARHIPGSAKKHYDLNIHRAVREMIEAQGAFIEIYVATPLEVCEARDRKGLYAKARQGLIPEFTGISDPYEVPEAPELRVDMSQCSPMEAVQGIYLYLLR